MQKTVRARIIEKTTSITETTISNNSGRTMYLHKITVTSKPDNERYIVDIKIGSCTQTACAGAFKASILEYLPPLGDPIEPGEDIAIFITPGDLEEAGEFVLTLGEEAPRGSDLLLPFGSTQLAGAVTKIIAARSLYEAVSKEQISVSLIVTPEDGSPSTRHETEPRGECTLHLKSPLALAPGDNLDVRFEGNDKAKEFTRHDAVAILERGS